MPLTKGAEWLNGPDFWAFHEQMFGEAFYRNVANLVKVLRPSSVVDIGGGTGNFAARLRGLMPELPITIFERDIPLAQEAGLRVGPQGIAVRGGDLFDDDPQLQPLFLCGEHDLATCLNVNGYFLSLGHKLFFERCAAQRVLANFIILEDNLNIAGRASHSQYRFLGMQRGVDTDMVELAWDIGAEEGSLKLNAIRYDTLLRIASEAGFRLEAEWRYTDFKSERMMYFVRG